MRRARGFTLTELMTVIVIVGIFASLAIVSFSRNRRANDLDNFTNDVRDAINIARRRAISTGTTYLVDVRAGSVAWCQQDPGNAAQVACPSVAPYESSRKMLAGSEAQVVSYNATVDVGAIGTGGTAIGGGHSFLFDRTGTATSAVAAIPTGFTIYLSGVTDSGRQRKIAVYAASARPRIVDHW